MGTVFNGYYTDPCIMVQMIDGTLPKIQAPYQILLRARSSVVPKSVTERMLGLPGLRPRLRRVDQIDSRLWEWRRAFLLFFVCFVFCFFCLSFFFGCSFFSRRGCPTSATAEARAPTS